MIVWNKLDHFPINIHFDYCASKQITKFNGLISFSTLPAKCSIIIGATSSHVEAHIMRGLSQRV